MPIYEYKCIKCLLVEEVFEKYEDKNDQRDCIMTDCCGSMTRQLGMRSKPLVSDKDLVNARTYSGKK